MNNFDSSLDNLLSAAAEHLNAGQKDAAREVLREALNLDRNNLATWELLWRAAYNLEEELYSLKRILKINPQHIAARKRLAVLQPAGTKRNESQPLVRTMKRPGSRQKRQQASVLLLLLGAFVSIVCVSITGFALYRGGYIPFLFSSNMTATAMADRNASCQVLIEKAIQASGSYCGDTQSNTACYGNNTLKAELASTSSQRFSERGDIVGVGELKRLSAAPLNLSNSEWGIAVFKVVANLPRSLPGETVTMVVFGNSTLDNQSGDSENLESFYFSSELGQIVCEKIPFDGLLITSPDGSGIHFTVNGTELTLMGNASIEAVKNGTMQVSVYDGSARLVSNGQEQYVGAGQSSSVQLGGENGTEAISPPSAPEDLTGDELIVACTITGEYCSPGEVTPISVTEAQEQIQSAITATPTVTPTQTITFTPSPTLPPTYTLVVLPSSTPSPKATLSATVTRTPTKTSTPTRTKTPGPTKTPRPTKTHTNTPTNTLIPTVTPNSPSEPICGTVLLSALTVPNPNEIGMNITNNSGSSITINRFFAYWVKLPNSQKINRLFLDDIVIWNTSDPSSPSDIPTESNWKSGANRAIPNGATKSFLIRFQNALQPTGYAIHIVFDSGCQVTGTK